MGFFLSFEGIDGCGKSTQLALLRARLEAAGQQVVATREPGGTALAEAVRGFILHSQEPLAPLAELLLFGASRAQHVAQVIAPALAGGATVLSDRFADSSAAYQGGALGMDAGFINTMNAFACNGTWPEITFVLDLDPAEAWRRRAAAEGMADDRIEARGLEFQARVRAAYECIAEADPQRVVTLDAAQPAQVTHEAIVSCLRQRGLWPQEP